MAFIKEARGKPKPKPSFKGIAAIRLDPSSGAATRAILSRPKPKTTFVSRYAPPSRPAYNYPETHHGVTAVHRYQPSGIVRMFQPHTAMVNQQRALQQARLANSWRPEGRTVFESAFHDMIMQTPQGQRFKGFFDAPERPTQYFGTGRPAPRDVIDTPVGEPVRSGKGSVVESITDPLGRDPNYGQKLAIGFLAKQRATAQAMDAATAQASKTPAPYARPRGVRPTHQTATFDKALKRDPEFGHLTADKKFGTQNIAMASAFGLPVTGHAAERYLRDAGQIVAQGLMPSRDVPGLVLSADNIGAIQQVQAQVRARGYSADEVRKMNFGQLVGAATGAPKSSLLYGHHFGSKWLGTAAQQFLPSLARGIVGAPMGYLMVGGAMANDAWSMIHNRGLPNHPLQTRGAVSAVGQGMYDWGKNIYQHPGEATSHDPFGTILGGLALVRGGGSLGGKIAGRYPRFAPGRRDVAVHAGQNIDPEGKTMITTDLPPGAGPLIVPGSTPIPPPPLYHAPRLIEGHMGEQVGDVSISPLHREAGPATTTTRQLPPRPGPGMTDNEIAVSRKAHAEWHAHNERNRAARAQRVLANPEQRQAELDAMAAERDGHKEAAQKLRSQREGLLNANHIREGIRTLDGELGRATRALTEKPRSRALQRKVDSLHNDLQSQHDLLKEETDKAKAITNQLRIHNSWVDYLDHHISLAHIHSGLPHPDAPLRLKQVQARIKKGVRKGTTEGDIEALKHERDVLLDQQHNEALAPFKEAAHPTEDWFDYHSKGQPSNPIEHVIDVLDHHWKEVKQREHGYDSQQAHDDMQSVLNAVQDELDGNSDPELDGHIASQVDAALKDAHELFGEELNIVDEHVHPALIPKMQEFMRRVHERVIADHRVANRVERNRKPEPSDAEKVVSEAEAITHRAADEEALKHYAPGEEGPIFAEDHIAEDTPQAKSATEAIHDPGVTDSEPSLRHVMNNPDDYLAIRGDGVYLLRQALLRIDGNIKEIRLVIKHEKLTAREREQLESHIDSLKAGRKKINDAMGRHGELPEPIEAPPHASFAQPTHYNLQDMIRRPMAYRDAERFDDMEHAVTWLDQDIKTLRELYHHAHDSEARDRIDNSIKALIDDRQKIIDAIKASPDFIRGRPRFGVYREALAKKRETPLTEPSPDELYRMPPAPREAGPIPERQLPVPRHGGLAREGEPADFTEPGLAPTAYPRRGEEPPGQKQIGGPEQGLVKIDRYRSLTDKPINEPLIINRGRYSENLLDRLFEWTSDKLLESDNPALRGRQERFLAKTYMQKQAHARRVFYMKREELVPLVKKAERLTTSELTAAVQAHLQGVTPRQMLDMYKKLLDINKAKVARLNVPKRLKDILRGRTPSMRDLNELERILTGRPEYKAHLDWVKQYKERIKNEDYIDDHLFGDIITSTWKGSKDLENQVQMWQHVVDEAGDVITPEMRDFMQEARKQSNRVDNMLADEGILTHEIMDNRRYQRQKLVSSILGEELPINHNAIYVPDRATTTRFGDYLFKRSRSIDTGSGLFGARLQKHKGYLLEQGLVNPSFGTYYTGLSSAISKIDAVKLQKDVLEKLAHKVGAGQVEYDGDRFVLYDAQKGVSLKQNHMRAIMDALNRDLGHNEVQNFMNIRNRQNIRWHNVEEADRRMNELSPEELASAQQGDLYLVPRPVYDKMVAPITGTAPPYRSVRSLQQATRLFRRVALGWRPAYLIVNSADTFFRTGYFGGVLPAGFLRTARIGHEGGLIRGAREHGVRNVLRAGREERLRRFIPLETQRMTYAGNVLTKLHTGSQKYGWVEKAKDVIHADDLHDRLARARRAPYFGPTLDVAGYIARYPDYILEGTARIENYARESLILNKMLKEARKNTYKFYQFQRYFKGIDDNMKKAMEDIKNGVDPSGGDAMTEIIRDVSRVLGDFSAAENAYVQIAAPFYRWIYFITKFVLYESPVHYPGRTLLLNQLGQQGYASLSKMGIMPPNSVGALPVGKVSEEQDKEWNQIDKVVSVMYSQAWNGMSTVSQLFGIEPTSATPDPWAGIAHNMNPLMQAAFAAASLSDLGTRRQLRGPNGPIAKWDVTSRFHVFVGNIIKSFWPLMLDYDYGTQADTSYPLIHEVLKKEGMYAQPQSTFTERLTAALTGFRRRKVNITRLQMKNLQDALAAYNTVRKSLSDNPDPNAPPSAAQLRYDAEITKSMQTQLQYLSEWVKKYGDKSIMEGWDEPLRSIQGTVAVPNAASPDGGTVQYPDTGSSDVTSPDYQGEFVP